MNKLVSFLKKKDRMRDKERKERKASKTDTKKERQTEGSGK